MDDKGKSTAKKISLQLKKTEANQIKASSVCEQQVRHKQAAKIPVNVCFYVRWMHSTEHSTDCDPIGIQSSPVLYVMMVS